jgi:carboxymethylenebutenolidase
MTELERYLAEEVAEDHVDGIITRREAMRRLGMLGLSSAAASAMIAAEAQARTSGKGGGHHHGNDGKETTWAPPAAQPIEFAGPRGKLMASWAAATKPRGGVLVIHENRGLTAHITHVARRWAASGWSALALDLLSEEGGTASFPDEAAVAARLSQISSDPNSTRFVDDMQAAVTELGRRVGRRSPLGATGFCFGGGMVWNLLTSDERRLSAAAPFYGPFPTGGSLKGKKAKVLGIYAGNDDRVNATRAAARAALDAARLEYELLTFAEQAQPPTTPPTYLVGHAFFNDTGTRFNPAAAEEAWRRVVNWFNDADHDRGHH